LNFILYLEEEEEDITALMFNIGLYIFSTSIKIA